MDWMNYIRKKRWTGIALLLLLAVALLPNRSERVPAFAPASGDPSELLIIDAGHGGEDGGAVSLTGTPESGINLAIACNMEDILAFCGQPPLLLRRDDRSLHDSSAQSLREKKRSDLHNRVAQIEQFPEATLMSIHQNSFPNGAYHGAQVFYANESLTLPFAERTQTLLRETLDPSNQRAAKPISKDVYLMNHISCRAILVECGFLTNPEEEAKLRSSVYQCQLAVVLSGAWLQELTQM
ncbi:N-acetylmuramoyl-L-alanine amidase [Pseudoflavonifractor gallinarum]|nr:N-acetylmuramoyl-L-alanine amidase [Pseudoflavonifractor gallinarum]